MCGIAGRFNYDAMRPVDRATLEAMTDSMSHRGPDASGYHVAPGIGLGHRRLSIIDLSTGDQPLANENGTIWTVFNGEIYNFAEVRAELIAHGHRFRTNSDTEIIVHGYEQWGERCVEKFRGMFAFAVWDSTARRLMLARDRVGVKPLYYAELPGPRDDLPGHSQARTGSRPDRGEGHGPHLALLGPHLHRRRRRPQGIGLPGGARRAAPRVGGAAADRRRAA